MGVSIREIEGVHPFNRWGRQAAKDAGNMWEKYRMWCPRRGSNSRLRLRRPALYPLSYRGSTRLQNITLAREPTSRHKTLLWWTNPDPRH
tara:strand:- start:61 stop:330 length:270 start_codon:yes stop_codon:yes gene_type:complete